MLGKKQIKMSEIPMPEKKASDREAEDDLGYEEGLDEEEVNESPEEEKQENESEEEDALANFSDDELIAEMKKRGLTMESSK